MSFKAIQRVFERGSVCVTGMRGTGKDLLMSNIAVRRPQHVSNVPYGQGYIPLDFDKLDLKNTNNDLVNKTVTPYAYPYPEGVDVFISDIGVYFPSQFNDHLHRKYASLPLFLALSRQLGKGVNVHLNTQSLNRCWLAFREQSDVYIRCKWCKVFFGKLVVQRVILYDKYESCLNRADPFWYPPPPTFGNSESRRIHVANKKLAYQRYRESHGLVKSMLLIYSNKSSYDTYHFKTLLKGENTLEKSNNNCV